MPFEKSASRNADLRNLICSAALFALFLLALLKG
jgi:hypothetical protein